VGERARPPKMSGKPRWWMTQQASQQRTNLRSTRPQLHRRHLLVPHSRSPSSEINFYRRKGAANLVSRVQRTFLPRNRVD
jgi:hypothetical protein